MKKLLGGISLCGLLLCAASGFAEIRPGAFSLSPFIGGYTFDGVQHLETRPAFGLRAGYDFTRHVGAEAVFDYVNTEFTNRSGTVDVFNTHLDALYHFLPDQKLVPYIAAGYGWISIDPPSPMEERNRGAFNYGAGLKYFVTECMAVRGDVRHFVMSKNETLSNLEYTVGLTYLFGGEKPAPAQAPPPPPAPTSTLTVTPGSITQGQSATLDWTSQNATNCDIQPGIGSVQPQGATRITPSADTVYTLSCTGAGGTTSSTSNIQVTAPPKQEKVCIVLNIEFDTDKADIKPEYHAEIGKVAEFMKQYPESKGVIEGHTDNVGGYDYNMKLSERRAASVRNYLVEKYGVAPERLSSKGYGYTSPIADNTTQEGRQKNRRMEATFDCVIKR